LQQSRPVQTKASPTPAEVVDLLPRLQVLPATQRLPLINEFLAEQVVKVLALGAGTRIDLQRSVMEMGLDSLMAMELRNRIQSSLGVRISVADLLGGLTPAELAAQVLAQVSLSAETADVVEPEAEWEEGSV
jgi:acyl carrier protein